MGAPLKITRAADGSRLHVKLNAGFTAAELDEFISLLAEHRSDMNPPIPLALPAPGTPAAQALHVHAQAEPPVAMRRLRSGGLRLWARSAGLGWMLFDLAPQQVQLLAGHMAEIAAELDDGPEAPIRRAPGSSTPQ